MKYKVGDRVKVKSLQWFNENSDDKYNVVLADGWYFSKPMSILCGKELIIKKISHACNSSYYIMEDNTFIWTDEMIEGLVEEEIKSEPKFKIGDRVITTKGYIGKFEGWVSDYQVRVFFEESGDNVVIHPKNLKLVEEENIHNKWNGLKVELELSKSIVGVSNIESLHGERFMSEFVKAIIPPEGYQFVDENGNVINATKIVLEKKKKEYPKTYEECCRILQYIEELKVYPPFNADVPEYDVLGLFNSLEALRKLLLYRDAYWKIAGEEMGLGKPWEPDWLDDDTKKYVITSTKVFETFGGLGYINYILTFPTEEMRDAFYENFKELIERCKELL